MSTIIDIHAREILDSRGNPTVEVDVILEDGTMGRAAVPSGASTGAMRRWKNATATSPLHGQRRAGSSGRREWRDRRGLGRIDATEQVASTEHDRTRRHPEQGRLGANAILGVARTAKAAADFTHQPLFRYVGGTSARLLPVPMMNIINGGEHADNPIDIQEFMIMPVSADNIRDAVRMGPKCSTRSRKSCPRGSFHRDWRRRRLCAQHRSTRERLISF